MAGMQKRKIAGRAAAALFLLALLLPLIPRAAAGLGEEGTRVVRVAYPRQKGLTDVDAQGEYCGYTYEYLEEIAQYTGWTYEFVEPPDDSDEGLLSLIEMLREGQIDLMGSMLYSEELGEGLVYAGQSYGTVETVLQAPDDQVGQVTINSQLPQSFRVAVLNATGRTVEELEDYCRMNLIDPELILCANEDEQVRAVEQGRADMLLNTSLNDLEGMYTVASFAPKPFYFVTGRGGDPTLMEELNTALLSIEQSDPYFSTVLFEEYFLRPDEAFLLSQAELDYVSGLGPIRVGALADQPPFQSEEEKTGKQKGITADLLDYISQKTGLQFEFVLASSPDELYEILGRGECDLLAGVFYDYAFAREHGLTMTRPYLSAQYTRMMRPGVGEEGIEGKLLAMPRTTVYQGYTLGDVVWYDTKTDCVKALRDGKADYTYVDACTAQYYTNQPAYWNLETVPLAYAPVEMCFGIPKPADHRLMSILNRVIHSISVEERQNIITANTLREERLPFSFYVRQYPLETVSILFSVLSLIILLLLLLLRQRTLSNQAAAIELKKRLRVYAMCRDYFFEFSYSTHVLMVTTPSYGEEKQGVVEYKYQERDSTEEFWGLIHARRDGAFELRQLCEDGQWHWLSVTLETIYGEGGQPDCAIGKIRIIDQEKEEKDDLQLQANLDGLTGVYNIAAFRKHMERALDQMEEGQKGAFFLLDIDHFKEVNDTYGHLQGDEALRRLSRILLENVRDGDYVGRFGGDEFVVYLTAVRDRGVLEEKCATFCQKVREASRATENPLTISVGAVLSRSGDSYERLFQLADQALYQAKNAGRDRFQVNETQL